MTERIDEVSYGICNRPGNIEDPQLCNRYGKGTERAPVHGDVVQRDTT